MTRQENNYVENVRKHGSAHVGQDEVTLCLVERVDVV